MIDKRTMWSVPNLKAFLLGNWKLHRIIVDRDQAIIGRFDGEASFSSCARGLQYEENGTLAFGEHSGKAEQRYLYEFPESEGRASVRFRDGRAFHELDLSAGWYCVRHACDADRYDGVFTALSMRGWQSEWKVTGPRRHYGLVTAYTR